MPRAPAPAPLAPQPPPLPPPPPPPLPAAASARSPGLSSQYVAKIVSALNAHKVYPQEAIDREEEGRVLVEVTLASDGSLKQASVQQASTFDVLNRAALRAVQSVGRYPPPPDGHGDFHFTAPLQFKLDRR